MTRLLCCWRCQGWEASHQPCPYPDGGSCVQSNVHTPWSLLGGPTLRSNFCKVPRIVTDLRIAQKETVPCGRTFNPLATEHASSQGCPRHTQRPWPPGTEHRPPAGVFPKRLSGGTVRILPSELSLRHRETQSRQVKGDTQLAIQHPGHQALRPPGVIRSSQMTQQLAPEGLGTKGYL